MANTHVWSFTKRLRAELGSDPLLVSGPHLAVSAKKA